MFKNIRAFRFKICSARSKKMNKNWEYNTLVRIFLKGLKGSLQHMAYYALQCRCILQLTCSWQQYQIAVSWVKAGRICARKYHVQGVKIREKLLQNGVGLSTRFHVIDVPVDIILKISGAILSSKPAAPSAVILRIIVCPYDASILRTWDYGLQLPNSANARGAMGNFKNQQQQHEKATGKVRLCWRYWGAASVTYRREDSDVSRMFEFEDSEEWTGFVGCILARVHCYKDSDTHIRPMMTLTLLTW